jgi:hypothetical protein
MKDIDSQTAGPDINEFLKKTSTNSRRIRKPGASYVESANDGSERGLPTDAEPDA